MITIETVEQALMDAGFVPATQRPGIVYGGFKITPVTNGDTLVTYVFATGAERFSGEVRRDTVSAYISRMERELSRKGFKVTMFQPDSGADFWLRVLPEEAPGAPVDGYSFNQGERL